MCMARARRPGQVWFITRRTHHRQFRFLPTDEMRGAFHVVVDGACRRTGLRVLAFMAMSNHYHAVVEDVEGRISEWESEVNGLLARFANAVQGSESHVWDAQEGRDIALDGLPKIAEKVAYTLVNPTKAGLVAAPSAWPGAMTRLEDIGTGRGRVEQRPTRFFREKGPVAAEAALVSHTPSGCDEATFRAAVKAAYERQLAEARAAVRASGRGYLGVAKVLKQSPFGSPRTRERHNAGEQAVPLRRVAGSTPEQTASMVARELGFRRDYAVGLGRLKSGERDVVFPAGTNKLHHVYGFERAPHTAEAARAAS